MVPTTACATVDDIEVGFSQTARTAEDSTNAAVEVVGAKEVNESLLENVYMPESTSESTTREYNALPTHDV